ncbi:MAG: molybdenum transporter, periplasmic molybdate-binding protein [Propionibacteriaceae bacterium]|nr:molybdenum transporter, periplasmic molybdate-binding protein [Propionibacteriaceae bacterium]
MNTVRPTSPGFFPHKATNVPQSGRLRRRLSAQRHRRSVVPSIVGLAILILAACGGSPPESVSSSTPSSSITVAAAASLTEAFTEIGKDFEATKPGTTVIFSFGSSATLATQIAEGAPVDVFAAANPATMKTVTDVGAAEPPTNFVSNVLQIAVPKGNPGRITGLKDFADKTKKIAICAPQVPCGTAAVKVFAAAKITPAPDTLEQDVKATLQKVSSNEVDAALVYRTDVIAARDAVEGLEFSQAQQAVNVYPIAVLKGSVSAAAAQQFVDYVLSADGQAVLRKAGFGKP